MLKILINMRINKKLALFTVFFAASFILFAVISIMANSTVQINGPLYKDIMMGKDLKADVLPPRSYIVESYLVAYEMANETGSSNTQELIYQAKTLENAYNKSHSSWLEILPEGELKNAFVKDSFEPANKFYYILDHDFLNAVNKNDKVLALSILSKQLKPLYEEHKKQIEKVVGLANDYNNTEEALANSMAVKMLITLFCMMAAVVIVIMLMWYIMKKNFSPLIKVTETLKNLSEEEGDLTKRIIVDSKDEVGDLAEYFNKFVDKVQNIVRNISNTTSELGTSSKELLHVADALGVSVDNASRSITTMAAATEEMTASTADLASASEETSASVVDVTSLAENISRSINVLSDSSKDVSELVESVAVAVRKINNSLGEINRNCDRSIQITSNASEKADNTNVIINKLDMSSKQIEKIINVINDIADQTNMLALNAAIEAAGAGEAGKGFAVVANEVKELAKQTADATDEIGDQIENMQQNMYDAVKAMEVITGVINEISVITNTIADAVTGQSVSTNGILDAVVKSSERVSNITNEIAGVASNSQNTVQAISEASKGTMEIARNATEISEASNDIAENIEKINVMFQGYQETSIASGAQKTNDMANSLSKVTIKLENLVKQFKI